MTPDASTLSEREANLVGPMSQRRVLPHNIELEASVLGGVILRNDVLSQLDTLEVDDFYDMRHKTVFAAIRALESQARPIE